MVNAFFELLGVAAVVAGVALLSVPVALVIGGLVVVAVCEVHS